MTYRIGSPADWSAADIPIGLGGSVFGWIVSPEDTFQILDRFYEIGGRFIDTSDGYSARRRDERADSESLIGAWIESRGVADEMRIITKIGLCPGLTGLRAEVVRTAAAQSIERLRISRAEAVLAHADDLTMSPDEVADALAELVGPVAKRIGTSGFSPSRWTRVQGDLRRNHGLRLSVAEEEFSLVDRRGSAIVDDIEIGGARTGLICSASLGRGFLTGKFRNARGRVGARQQFVLSRYGSAPHDTLLNSLMDVAATLGTTPAAVSLRWLVDHPAVVLPLASVTNTGQLDDFVAAAELDIDRSCWELLDSRSRDLDRAQREHTTSSHSR